jgi:hypothetical protein
MAMPSQRRSWGRGQGAEEGLEMQAGAVRAAQVGADFRASVEQHDLDGTLALMSPDVAFHSPIVHRSYHGLDELRPVLAAVTVVFEDFAYTGEWSSEDGFVLSFRCQVDDRELEGVDILRVGASGLVEEFTVMVRPYSGATALRERMAQMLAAAQG